MSLTDIAVRLARARDRAYKLADGGGLCQGKGIRAIAREQRTVPNGVLG
jgi:hypothetical protein